MRVLMLAQFYPPVIGGEQQHVRNLSRELVRRGHDVAVATLAQDGSPPFELDEGVRVHRIRGTMQRAPWLFTGRKQVPPFPDPEVSWALRDIIAHVRPEIVHAHNWFVHSFLPFKRWSGAKLALTLHDYSFACPKKSFMVGEIPCSGPELRKCLDCAVQHYGPAKGIPTMLTHRVMWLAQRQTVDICLPVSRAVAAGNQLAETGLPFRVIPNFVPDDVAASRTDVRQWTDQLPSQPYVLFVGALQRIKGVDVLIRAYAGITNAPPLVLIGSVWSESPTDFPPNVTVLRNWPHDAVMAAWRRSLVGVIPSIWPDPCPTVAMEAMAVGRPVVSSRIGGLSDLVLDGETGFLVPPGDSGALQQALERLLRDVELRTRMGRAAEDRVKEFTASAVVPRIESVYRDLGAGETSRENSSDGSYQMRQSRRVHA